MEILGLRNASEPTFQMIAIILHLCIGENLSPEEREVNFAYLKAEIRTLAGETTAVPTGIITLPGTLDELITMKPSLREAFSESDVGRCPFSASAIFAMKKLYPMRQSRCFGGRNPFWNHEEEKRARNEELLSLKLNPEGESESECSQG